MNITTQIISYPVMNEIINSEFFDYIKNQIKELDIIWQQPLDDLKTPKGLEGNVLRSIRSGGKGSFTNKISEKGYFNKHTDLQTLFRNTKIFYGLAHKITNKFLYPYLNYKLFSKYIQVYRFVRREEHTSSSLLQPIPMSCSWSLEFANKWRHNQNGCIYEIIIKQNSLFLTLSYPSIFLTKSYLTIKNKKYYLSNQSQLEITLPPCILIFKGKRRYHCRGRSPTQKGEHEGTESSRKNGIFIYTYIAEEFEKNQILHIFYYVKKNGIIFNKMTSDIDSKNISQILKKLSTIEKRLKNIELNIEKMQNSCEGMDTHINFIDSVYTQMKYPLDFISNKINYITGTSSTSLPLKIK